MRKDDERLLLKQLVFNCGKQAKIEIEFSQKVMNYGRKVFKT